MLKKSSWHYPILLIALLIILFLLSSRDQRKEEVIQIGIPEGAAGLLARYVLDAKPGRKIIRDVRFEPYALYDCCASASQYALGSGRLDMAILCPEAAKKLIEKDGRFEITGPVIMNSDIFITRLDGELSQTRIAVSQKRTFQHEMVLKRFGTRESAVPMFHGAVPFAFARGVVQGAVLDITKAFALEGEISSAVIDGHHVCTYVMVNKKSLRKNSYFHHFLTSYKEAVREMDDTEKLLYLMQKYVSKKITRGDVITWKKMDVRFIFPSSSLLLE